MESFLKMDNVPKVYFNKDEIIFREGDSTNSIYLVESGKIQIFKNAGAKRIILATQGVNSIFGEMTMIDGKARSATAMALEDSCCRYCSSERVIEEINKIDDGAREALKRLVETIRQFNKKMAHSSIKSEIIRLSAVESDDTNEDVKVYDSRSEYEDDVQLQATISALDPFIQSLFRVLFAMAFSKNN